MNLDKKSYENDLLIAYSMFGSSCPPDEKGRNLATEDDAEDDETLELLREDLDEINEASDEYSFFKNKVITIDVMKVAINRPKYIFLFF